LQWFDVTWNKICKELTSSSPSSWTIVAGCLWSWKYDSWNSVWHPSNCWWGASAMRVENLWNWCPSWTTIRYILITSWPFFVCTKN
jgi:hypothetical protein